MYIINEVALKFVTTDKVWLAALKPRLTEGGSAIPFTAKNVVDMSSAKVVT